MIFELRELNDYFAQPTHMYDRNEEKKIAEVIAQCSPFNLDIFYQKPNKLETIKHILQPLLRPIQSCTFRHIIN